MSGIPFTFPAPDENGQQQLTFSAATDFENYRIRLTAYAAVNTNDIDTSTGDVTISVPVDYVDFWISEVEYKSISFGLISKRIHRDFVSDRPDTEHKRSLARPYAFSAATWTPIPRQTDHQFHGKSATRSSANWTAIPPQTGQFEAA